LYSNRFAVNNFDHEASRAKLDLTADSEETLKQQSRMKRWDRKKKKMVAVNVVSNCISYTYVKSFHLVASLHSCVSIGCCATITGAESNMFFAVLLLYICNFIFCDVIVLQGQFMWITFMNLDMMTMLQSVFQVFQFQSRHL
jgi:hypothetical protein